MKVTIMVGASGSGKSTYAKPIGGAVISADDHFVGADGVYRFDPARIGQAHSECLRDFVEHARARSSTIVVDNTNSTVMEAAPYLALAMAYGYDVRVVVMDTSALPGRLETLAGRTVHGTPVAAITHMEINIAAEWPHALPWHWRPENEARITIDRVPVGA